MWQSCELSLDGQIEALTVPRLLQQPFYDVENMENPWHLKAEYVKLSAPATTPCSARVCVFFFLILGF